MVLTIRVVTAVNGHTRRGVLGVAAGSAMVASTAGCSLFGDDAEPERPDALQPLLNEALKLAAELDHAALAVPSLARRLTPLAADHRAHATELARVIGKPAASSAAPDTSSATPDTSSAAPDTSSATPDAGNSAATLRGLRAATQAAQRNAATAARKAPAARATLVGSIAACRASHSEALR